MAVSNAIPPLSAAEFAEALNRLGPFERTPHFAVAVSGGADSMALCLLAQAEATRRRGRLTAITVDHGLRQESAQEARQVGAWLKKRGIAHVILTWQPQRKPTANRQAAAREARYALLGEWCRAHGAWWLLTAHHQDDQAETLLLRLSRGSGLAGLSGMSAVYPMEGVTVLRPLLAFPKSRLEATLREARQEWIDDPSNGTEAYARNRLRQWMAQRPGDLLATPRLADAAAALARARAALEAQAAEWLARYVEIFPGYLTFEPSALKPLPQELRLRVLERCFATIGGDPYPPRLEKLARVEQYLRRDFSKPFTFHGCMGWPASRRPALLFREPAACEAPMPLGPQTLRWDRRWEVTTPPGITGSFHLGALGADGVKTTLAALPKTHALRSLPKALLAGFPCIRRLDEPWWAPHMDYRHPNAAPWQGKIRFLPAKPLAGPVFFGME